MGPPPHGRPGPGYRQRQRPKANDGEAEAHSSPGSATSHPVIHLRRVLEGQAPRVVEQDQGDEQCGHAGGGGAMSDALHSLSESYGAQHQISLVPGY